MTLGDAINGLGEQTEWLVIKDFIKEQRDMCLVDFQDYTHVDNPQKLARLSGEIAGLTRIVESLENAERDTDTHQQFKNEHRALLNRWLEESDIEDHDMAKIVLTDIEEWMDDEVIEFESDIDLEDDEHEA